MKKTAFYLIMTLAIIFKVSTVYGKIYRVGYFGTSISGQDYGDFQSAHDAASKGDTLLIFPGSYSGSITKRLVIIGPGYLVASTVSGANANLQTTTGSVSFGNMSLQAGSDSSIFEGIDGLTLVSGGTVTLNGLIFLRCNLNILTTLGYTTYLNIKLLESIVSIGPAAFQGNATFQGLLVENSIINTMDLSHGPFSGCTGVYNNNIFTSAPNLYNGAYSLSNNIFLSTTAPGNIANCVFSNNIASNNTIPSGNNDLPNVTLSTLFVGYPTQGTYSYDGRYVLSASSPAKGAGANGADCGIFGGTNSYRLSGIPPVPSFYNITAPSNIASTNPYPITFSVRSNN